MKSYRATWDFEKEYKQAKKDSPFVVMKYADVLDSMGYVQEGKSIGFNYHGFDMGALHAKSGKKGHGNTSEVTGLEASTIEVEGMRGTEAECQHYHDYHKERLFSQNWPHSAKAFEALKSGKGTIMPDTSKITWIDGKISDDDYMVLIQKEIKDKESKINQIIKVRKKFVKDFFESLEKIDEYMIRTHILDWGIEKPFLKYLLSKMNKKVRKKTKKMMEKLRFSTNMELVRLIGPGKDTYVHLIDGERWFAVKRLLSLIKKYAPIYINDMLKTKYTDLSSNIDNLVFDDEKVICETCGAENDNIAAFCNNCGNRF